MPIPTEANDREFWWVRTKWGLEVVQILADEMEQGTYPALIHCFTA